MFLVNCVGLLKKQVYFFLRSTVNLNIMLRYFLAKNSEIIVKIHVNTQHPAWGYKNSVECLNSRVSGDSARWLLSTYAQKISELGLVTVVTEIQYGITT
jgi:hypothetical protein